MVHENWADNDKNDAFDKAMLDLIIPTLSKKMKKQLSVKEGEDTTATVTTSVNDMMKEMDMIE